MVHTRPFRFPCIRFSAGSSLSIPTEYATACFYSRGALLLLLHVFHSLGDLTYAPAMYIVILSTWTHQSEKAMTSVKYHDTCDARVRSKKTRAYTMWTGFLHFLPSMRIDAPPNSGEGDSMRRQNRPGQLLTRAFGSGSYQCYAW